MNNSIYLARVIGLSLSILSLALLINAKHITSVITMLFQNDALQFILGILILIIGSLLVVSHNIWKSSWVVIITILSWLILIKGSIYLIFPGWVPAILQHYSYSTCAVFIGGIIDLLIGLYLCYMGFLTSFSKQERMN